jgi:hypothetical protein
MHNMCCTAEQLILLTGDVFITHFSLVRTLLHGTTYSLLSTGSALASLEPEKRGEGGGRRYHLSRWGAESAVTARRTGCVWAAAECSAAALCMATCRPTAWHSHHLPLTPPLLPLPLPLPPPRLPPLLPQPPPLPGAVSGSTVWVYRCQTSPVGALRCVILCQ